MKWSRSNGDPVTTNSRVAVFNGAGGEGWVRVRWDGQFQRPQLYGSVLDDAGRVLDREPEIVPGSRYLE